MLSTLLIMTAAALLAQPQGPVPSQAAPPPAPPAAEGPPPAERARPAGSLSGYVASDDYPPSALRAGEEGTVQFRLTIAPDGRVTRCEIVASSGSAALDDSTCQIMTRRARFTPARDASGRPVQDHYVSRIIWRISEDGPGLDFAAVVMTSIYTVAADGSISCTFEFNGQGARRTGADCGETSQLGGGVGESELRIVSQFTPAGTDFAAADTGPWGELVAEAEAEVTLTPLGSIGQCRVLRLVGRARTAPDFCEFIRAGALPSFVASAGPEPRGGRIRVSLYRRLGTRL